MRPCQAIRASERVERGSDRPIQPRRKRFSRQCTRQLVPGLPTLERGFSLIEVLVALVILSVGLIAASRAAFVAVSDQGFLRDRTLARWVAHNQLASLRLDSTRAVPGARLRDMVTQGGVRFEVVTSVTATPSPLFARVEVEVRRASDPTAPPTQAGAGSSAPVLAHAVGFAALRRL
ncbi:MAG: type II secretion system minor pseudopilin GspI [Casimicrobiaceae bacterium]|nr:type II secretion system minor pseudopilin GspI [Casimicrobiaceae bacterium]